MAGIDINLSKELLPGLLSNQGGLAEARRRLAEFRRQERVIRIFPNDQRHYA